MTENFVQQDNLDVGGAENESCSVEITEELDKDADGVSQNSEMEQDVCVENQTEEEFVNAPKDKLLHKENDNRDETGPLQALNERVLELMSKLQQRMASYSAKEESLRRQQENLKQQETKLLELNQRLANVEILEKSLQAKHKALECREASLQEMQKDLQATYEQRLIELEHQHAEWQQQRTIDTQAMFEAAADFNRDYQQLITSREAQCANYIKEQLLSQEKKLSEQRTRAMESLVEQLETERIKRLAAIEEELAVKEEELRVFQENYNNQKAELAKEKMSNMRDKEQNQQDKTKIQIKVAEGRKAAEQDVRNQVEQLKIEVQAQEDNYNSLLEKYRMQREELARLEAFKNQYGDNPFELLTNQLESLKKQKRDLEDKLASCPNDFDKAQVDSLQAENKKLNEALKEANKHLTDLQVSAISVDKENAIRVSLEERVERQNTEIRNLKMEIDGLNATISRLNAGNQRAQEREERIRSIKKKIHNMSAPDMSKLQENLNEVDWLEKVGRCCLDYGYRFSRRILYAYHTALKIADFSTITVLAGVSGTGKSKLPSLYASFGGFNFISVSVQPNWDSQESMLGFFNSIDNKFDAQPLLRFLAQSGDKETHMDQSMNIVLLDEMNLAHVEHYFAEFLSKLEERGDRSDEDVPKIDINIGADMDPYELPLARNVLWTGTMNQDETTKSLSDKVLDRGIIINFPRPKLLISRHRDMDINTFMQDKGISMLTYDIWRSWAKKPEFTDAQQRYLDSLKDVVQEINDKLAKVGRALGHRVWQSIEYYIANYPTVIAEMENVAKGELTDSLRKAMNVAFEDQLVQKVMPKLRGIETSGNSLEYCLRPIQGCLTRHDFSLQNDFINACKQGYGQFMWNSAEYISDTDIAGQSDDDKE